MGKSWRTAWIAMACAALAAAPAMADDEGERMIAEVNELRASSGLPPLASSPALTHSAERFASKQMRTDTFGHGPLIRTGGSWSALGEAISMHRGHRPRVHITLRRWTRSPPHAALLLSPLFTDAGVGLSRGRLGRGRATIWVIRFGRG
jgi:uncharacterized protein YkwD